MRPVSWAFAVALICLSTHSVSGEPRIFRVSLENARDHVQVRMAARFLERVSAAAGPELKVVLYDGATLFRDSDVVPALATGKIEMAIPGIWQLDRYAPDFSSLFLPSVFGQEPDAMVRLVDGPFGAYLCRALESAYPVRCLGRWFELGEAHTFFAGEAVLDFPALRVRVPGGIANEERLRVLGAQPKTIPWPDLPAALRQRRIDAVVSTYETVHTSELPSAGISAVSEDRHYYGFYVPLVQGRFWDTADASLRKVLADAWEATVDEERAAARLAQSAAKDALRASGLAIRIPSAASVARRRSTLMSREREIASRIPMSDSTLERLHAALEASR